MSDRGVVDVDGPVVRRGRRRPGSRRRGHAGFARTLLAVLVVLLASAAGALLVVSRSGGGVLDCRLADRPGQRIGADSFVYAADGSRLGVLPTSHNRESVRLSRMSHWITAATVAIEDRRFWEHGALDYPGIVRAAFANLKAGQVVQGGSTITQQLVRDRYLGDAPMTFDRKVTEACLAMRLAGVWPKRRILENYLDRVFYGHHAYGIEAAARTYFSRSAASLTLEQASLLAGLPQAPSLYDPLRHPRAARLRRNDVLRAMRDARVIPTARYRPAAAARLRLRPSDRYRQVRAPTFFGAVAGELEHRFGRWKARHGGLRVHTTLDPHLQALSKSAMANWLSAPSDPAAALVAIDPSSGAIRAMSAWVPGGRSLRFNLASQSRRQAGSAFKVFALTAAIEQGIPLSSVWTGPPALTITDERCLDGSTPWAVHNFADETAGTMSLLQAIANSVNTIFAQVVMRVGPGRVVGVAHRMGVRSPLKPVCSIALGPEGVSPLEMTDAFATLASGGIHHDPQDLRRVAAPDGRVLARLRPHGDRALSPGVASAVTYALSGVIAGGTGTAADPGRPAAGKTGTAEDNKDAWFCGFVPQLATCVWLGYPDAEIPMHGLDGFAEVVGGSVPARIWHDFMVPALAGRRVRPIPQVSASQVRVARPVATPATGFTAAPPPTVVPPAPAPVAPVPAAPPPVPTVPVP